MNIKKMGAIALTLIICCPLALGYAMAFDNEEVNGWETTSQASISDLLLNAESEYTLDSNSPQNNASIWQSRHYTATGDEIRTYAVDWNRTGTTNTSQPIVEELNGTVALNRENTTNITNVPSAGMTIGYGASDLGYTLPTGTDVGYITLTFSDASQRANYFNHGQHSFIIDGATITEPLSIYSLTFVDTGNGLYIADATEDTSLGGSEDLTLILGKTCTHYVCSVTVNTGGTISIVKGNLTQIGNGSTVTFSDGSGTGQLSTAWTGTLTAPLITAVGADGTVHKSLLTQSKTIVQESTKEETSTYSLSGSELFGWDPYNRSGQTVAYTIPDNTQQAQLTFTQVYESTQTWGHRVMLMDTDTMSGTSTTVGGVNNVTLQLTELNGYPFLEVVSIGYTASGTTNTLKSGDILGFWISYGSGQTVSMNATIDTTSEYTYNAPYTGNAAISVSGSNVILTGTAGTLSYTDVQTVYFGSMNSAITDVEVDYYGNSTSTYANTAYGWKLPTAQEGSSLTASWWANLQKNTEVNLMVDFSGASTRTIALASSSDFSIPSETLQIGYSNEQMTVNGTLLGAYTKAAVVLTGSGWTVNGIQEWPAMTADATTYNSMSGTWNAQLSSFYYVYMANVISGTGTGAIPDVSFRVDRCSIVAGTFPSTKDLTFDPSAKFPGSYTVYINSVGVYGDSFDFAGQHFELNDNYQFTLDGRLTSLRGASLTSWKHADEESYTNSINGITLGTSKEPATITFSGEWSLTATQYKMEDVTRTVSHWKSGTFAFDETDYGICALIVAFFVFIVLGAMRPLNGPKIAFLALVCAVTTGVILSIT